MKKVRIIGAGISGLLCAYYAAKRGYSVEVFESQKECGGKLRTLQGKHGLMETAANAILADAEVESVARDIHLKLVEKKSTARRRYIYANQRIQRWPLSFMQTLYFLKFLFMWKIGSKKIEPIENETLEIWSSRVLHPQITKNLLEPACLGIFGETSKKLSARLIYNYFFSKKKKPIGILRGSVAPEKGMGQWAELLVKYLQSKNVKFYLSEDMKEKIAGVKADENICIIATDLENAKNLLSNFNDSRSAILTDLPQVDLVSVNVFYNHRPVLQNAGFGVLFAREEQVIPLGVLFNSDIFQNSEESTHSETWIFGSSEQMYSEKSDEYFLSNIRATRQKVWSNEDVPLEFRINRWPHAIPLYGLGLEKSLKHLEVKSGSVHLMGNYLGEIGLNRLFHRAKSLIDSL